MNADRLRAAFTYERRITPTAEPLGWRFTTAHPSRVYLLKFSRRDRRFCLDKLDFHRNVPGGVRMSRKLCALLKSMLPPEELARCLAASIAA